MSIKIPDLKENYEKVLSQDCINFIEELNLRFNDKRNTNQGFAL